MNNNVIGYDIIRNVLFTLYGHIIFLNFFNIIYNIMKGLAACIDNPSPQWRATLYITIYNIMMNNNNLRLYADNTRAAVAKGQK